MREKQELGSFESSYDSVAKAPLAFGEVGYGSKSSQYKDEISQDEIDRVVDPSESDE